MTAPGDAPLTDQPFIFVVDGVEHRAHQNGVIERREGDNFVELPDDEGRRAYDTFLAQSEE